MPSNLNTHPLSALVLADNEEKTLLFLTLDFGSSNTCLLDTFPKPVPSHDFSAINTDG